MNDELRKEFEVTYRACFPIAAELQPNLFSFELDDDEYVEAKVHVAFTLWQAARATAEQPEPDALLRAFKRIEELRKGLFQVRDAMRVMSDWVRKSDPAGHSWAVRMVDQANDVLSHKSQQDAAIESKPAEQSVPVLPMHGSFHTGVLVKLLLDSAFEILRPDCPEDCPEEPWMRVALGKKYWAILTATPCSIESQRSGDGS